MSDDPSSMNSSRRPRKSLSGISKYAVWLVLGLAVAIALAAAAAVTTPSNSFPITVDGVATSPNEYSGSGSLSFKTGSLYSTDPASRTNSSTYLVTNNLTGQRGYWFCGKIESTVVGADTYVAGQSVGLITFSINRVDKIGTSLNKGRLIVTKGAAGFVYTVELTDPVTNVVVSGPPSSFGILVATKETTGQGDNSFTVPALVTEFAMPLSPGAKLTYPTAYPADGLKYRITTTYYTPEAGNLPNQITDGVISVTPVTVKNKTSYTVTNDAFFVPGQTVLGIGNIGSLDPTKGGTIQVVVQNVPVTITDADAAAALAGGTISIRDFDRNPPAESGLDFLSADGTTGGTFFTTGAHPSKYTLRTNTDGTKDLVLQFSVPDLVDQSEPFYWGPDTKHVELAGVVGSSFVASKVTITISSQ